MPEGTDLAERLRSGDLSAAPAVLNLVENQSPAARSETEELLAAVSPSALGREPAAHVVGVTGPPGVGKSSLLSRLVSQWRARGRSVAVLAVDPSSRRSGGSLLGDRARIEVDPADRDVYIRSTAVGERLGGLAPATRAAASALAAAFDVVVIETVGVGQSETEVADVADTVVVVVQPGSGDVLQFLKSGIMEIPDVLVVTKADLGQVAMSALRDVNASLRSLGKRSTRTVAVSSLPPPKGMDELVQGFAQHWLELNRDDRRELTERRLQGRRAAALTDFAVEHGERGLRALGGRRAILALLGKQDPGMDVPALVAALETGLSGCSQ